MTTLYILTGLTVAITIFCLVLVLRLSLRKGEGGKRGYDEIKNEIRSESDRIKSDVGVILKMNNEMIAGTLTSQSLNIEKALSGLAETQGKNTQMVEARFREFNLNVEQKLDKIREENSKSLTEVRADNEKQLNKMRETVDEKLSSTLEERFNNSFKLVGDRLDAINRSFSEMQTLQAGVTDLKKIFSNVKSRGTWGEVALESILSQILSTEQYARNVNVSKRGSERVDFVINLPGKNDESVFLPVDAKFPVEDYLRLVDASEIGDATAVEEASKALERQIKKEADSISSKYICPPKTTDFAIMYLPSESLFSEVIRRAGLSEELQNRYRVVVCGPTTLAALLNSLQMGFRTVAIEKRSTEIWRMLSSFQKDFATFSELLLATKKKLEGVTNTIDSANKRTDIIRKRLSQVDSIPSAESPFGDGNISLIDEKAEENIDD
ncbi:MAG TPA: DNA recombination protein RmuC [Clostridia bacterium]|nr:DNA recombination protein RmuC [Clostridia bacterium]